MNTFSFKLYFKHILTEFFKRINNTKNIICIFYDTEFSKDDAYQRNTLHALIISFDLNKSLFGTRCSKSKLQNQKTELIMENPNIILNFIIDNIKI